MSNQIYLDNAATTPLGAEARAAMEEAFDCWGNASSIHRTGQEAHRLLDRARRQAAEALDCEPREVYFTSGGSESDNWALTGAAIAAGPGAHLITTAIEHEAVLNTCRFLERMGYSVTFLTPDSRGVISPEAVEAAIRPETCLISVMTANNEIGTVQPIRAISGLARERGILFHTDAVQAVGMLPVNAGEADLLSLSAHKFHGPKGVGVLTVRQGVRIEPLIHGGQQERRHRAGTENIPGIAGLGAAIEAAVSAREKNTKQVAALRDRLWQGIRSAIPGVRLNGHPTERLPGNLHITVDGADGEAMLLRLDLAGIAASSGSACTSGSPEPSHVLSAIGLTEEQAKNSLRFSLGTQNTAEEIDETVHALAEIVQDLRRARGYTV